MFLAEDDAGICDFMLSRLSEAGYRTAFAADGAEALKGIYASSPDVVLLDINMPKMSGFDVLKQMKADSRLAKTPVLILTARGEPDDVRLALKLGAKDYMAKPFNQLQLMARVSRLLRMVQAPASPPAEQPSPTQPVSAPLGQLARTKPLPLSDTLDDIDIESI